MAASTVRPADVASDNGEVESYDFVDVTDELVASAPKPSLADYDGRVISFIGVSMEVVGKKGTEKFFLTLAPTPEYPKGQVIQSTGRIYDTYSKAFEKLRAAGKTRVGFRGTVRKMQRGYKIEPVKR